ncbi:hypothetical protein ACIPSJ_08895 [Streptomyces sp. NPDC090088]|uniref:wHTH domain-containing protein n=1 Tax=Streptomyces sp. NPDC090088 TaxID=3365944 RepID=UPI00380A4413
MTYEEQLERLVRAAGEPSAAAVGAEIVKRRGPSINSNTLRDWLQGKVVPRDSVKRHAFLGALTELARNRTRDFQARLTREQWDGLADLARKAREGRAVDPPSSVRPCLRQDWLDAVTGSKAWQLIEPEGQEQAETIRKQVLDVVRRLAELDAEQRAGREQGPWHDEKLACRMTRRTDLLLREAHRRLKRATLAPAEAALIVLLPFLYQVNSVYTVASLAHVDPTDLDDHASGGPDREKYNVLLRNHKRLVRQALRGDELPDRDDGRPEIGWWLFHQWTKQEWGSLGTMLADLRPADARLDRLLDRQLVTRLLACAHVPPRKLYGRGRDGLLRSDPFPVELDGGDWQEVRENLVGPLFAIAHAMALEATELPAIVVEHMGIPDPVTVEPLLDMLDDAAWIPGEDTLVLRATCDHPAVVAALGEHVRHVDGLLRGARRTRPTEEIGALPVYAHADEVHEGERTEERTGEVIRFRLDEARIQELLMGENLYRDRSLAIRELYQNALDACRMRRAWEHARDGRDRFDGEITFEQDYDRVEKRHYLECRDNGIGMDETVLAEVFSQAGVRLSDHVRHQEEAQRWRKDGITVHPNSRFGIGVLSYFMLADEIRVTTRPAGGGAEQLTVLITGPGHYFRVAREEADAPVGTTVRLYLRDGDKAPSCVRELRRLLGISEFRTRARHGKQTADWEPGELREQKAPLGGQSGFTAHGNPVSWPDPGQGVDGQVVWCEAGGGLLADGIFIEPRVRRGVLAGAERSSPLRGVVVNLTGETRPKDLSVDRTEILESDVDEQVERLIRDALPALLAAEPPLLTTRWLAEVSVVSPRLADIVTEAAGEAGYQLELHGHSVPVAQAGFFLPDIAIIHQADQDLDWEDIGERQPEGVIDDVTLLWRLLAHGSGAELSALTELVPELSEVRAVLAARPTDLMLRTVTSIGSTYWPGTHGLNRETMRLGHAFSVAETCGMRYREVAARRDLLGLVHLPPRDDAVADSAGAALLDSHHYPSQYRSGMWLDQDVPVPPGHLLKAHLVLNIGIDEALDRLAACGFVTPGDRMPTETPEDWVVSLLSRDLTAQQPWLPLNEPVAMGHVLRSVAETGQSFQEVVDTLLSYGYHPEVGELDEQTAQELLRRGVEWGWSTDRLSHIHAKKPVPLGLLAEAAIASGSGLRAVARPLEKLGLSVGTLPEEDPMDTRILSAGWPDGAVYRTGDEIPLAHLAEAAHATGLPPAVVASRFRAYGLNSPETRLPERADVHDRVILGEVGGLGPDRLVSLQAVVLAANEVRKSPKYVVDRLTLYGLGTSLTAPPARPSRNDIELVGLESYGVQPKAPFFDWEQPVPIHHLVSVGSRTLMEHEEVVERLTAFGFRMPERAVEDLDEVDRRLCLATFRQGRNAEPLPLALRHPIPDFLKISALAEVPLPELLARLTRLGVDLSRVTEAVRVALPQVPGLVKTPTEP